MGWHQLTVTTEAARLELVADALWGCGAAGIEERLADDGRDVVLVAGFPDALRAHDAARRLSTMAACEVRVTDVEDDGLDAWRAWARPMRAGRFTITPPWCEPPADGSETLWIEPGRTFGSGSHATTRLMVELVETVVRPGDVVLDVGTGSGVLAVAAARSGAARVVAIDIDPTSPAVVAANAAANGVSELVIASTTPIDHLVGDPVHHPHDVVLANLLASTISELGEALVAATRPGGHLVLSGLLDDRWRAVVDEVVTAAAGSPGALELHPGEVRSEQGWVAVVLRRGPSR